ncbi:hypothetical protein [Azospirillum sp. Sh1]|uniref:hypothetical protein n=1 Tax=Azospirillum sp. Sh1 TaxID=2607285 RepID=UPI0011EC4B9F|nr:hypothetical protein [Azospirillum sp. Sh1]KAA0570339.1 hypothetical protein FZ029_30860 [Azospirillum sp. Sh1]
MIVELEDKAKTLEETLSAPPPPPVMLPANLADLYREWIHDLATTLADPDHRIEARDRLRPFIDRVAVRFSGIDARSFELEMEGDVVALLCLGLDANTPKAGAGASGLRKTSYSVKLVAGARNHRELTLPPVAV